MSRHAAPNAQKVVPLVKNGGLSYTEIAERLGLTKGQVVGIVHRARARGELPAATSQGKTLFQAKPKRLKRLRAPVSIVAETPAPPAPFADQTGCLWIDAKDPVAALRAGEGLYCGAPVVDRNRVWCADHHRRVYAPAKQAARAGS
jgi:hypothetical protein